MGIHNTQENVRPWSEEKFLRLSQHSFIKWHVTRSTLSA